MSTQALLAELLLSGFFAIACFRARPSGIGSSRVAPRTLFVLTDRLERLRRSRWQWFSMILVLVLLRVERGTPMIVEFTAFAQFLIFLTLPTQKTMHAIASRA